MAGILGFVQTAPAAAQIPCGYEISAIIRGPLCAPFGYPPTIPSDIGESGEVVGYYYICTIGPNVPFLWTEGSGFVTLDLPAGFNEGGAWGIDAQTGWIVGSMTAQGLNRPTAALWMNPYGVATDLGTLPGGNYSTASAASNGAVVGWWGNNVTGHPGSQPFLWEEGQMIDLGPDLGTPNGRASDLSDAGGIVGWMGQAPQVDARAFIWDDGEVTDLGPIPGGFTSLPWAINSGRQVCGNGRWTDPETGEEYTRAFFWEDGEMTNLGVLPGLLHSGAADLNDNGLVVGGTWGSGGAEDGFIWYEGVMVNLNTMIPPDAGVHVGIAYAINNAGLIACRGSIVDNLDTVALVLTPVDQARADLDGDGMVGFADFVLLLDAWGPCPAPCPPAGTGDLNCDCTVNVIDFLELLASWG